MRNNTKINGVQNEHKYPADKTIHELFSEQARKTPNQLALVYQDSQLNYDTLNHLVNKWAHYLKITHKIQPDNLIALYMNRSEQMIIAILAVLKSGAAYVPIDPDCPEEQLNHILDDTKTTVMITNKAHKQRLSQILATRSLIELLILDEDKDHLPTQLSDVSSSDPLTTCTPQNLCYVIYTSGTTGVAKGVMIEHQGVINTVWGLNTVYDLTKGHKLTAFSSYTFDVSVAEFFVALLRGAELHLLDETLRHDPNLLSRYLIKHDINYVFIPPILLSLLPKIHYKNLKAIIYAGEPCQASTAAYWSNRYRLYNYYGPTETSIYAIGKQVHHDDVHLIGKPMPNVQAYILNEYLQPVLGPEIGMLYLSGPGVARGYLNQPDLSKEKFIANPFQTSSNHEHSVLFQTGDWVRYADDGNIEYIGRTDSQVKIRGFRIELGQIESVMLTYPGIRQALALTQKQPNENVLLMAYYVAHSKLNTDKIKIYLGQHLPSYMLPNAVIWLKEIPITRHGKIDISALPTSESDLKIVVTPNSIFEATVCKIFAETIDIPAENVGLTDNFFKLGGNSIAAIHTVNYINHAFQTNLTIAQLFEMTDIQSLVNALIIQKKLANNPCIIEKSHTKKAHYPLSFMQEQLLAACQIGSTMRGYHCPSIINISSFNTDSIKRSLNTIITRHEILRTQFYQHQNHIYQKVMPLPDNLIEIHQFCSEEAYHQFRDFFILKPFDLYHDIPIRIAICNENDKRHLVIVIHHVATDGWSTKIFYKELFYFCTYFNTNNPQTLDEDYLLRIQYKDFCLWHKESDLNNRQLRAFWSSYLEDFTVANFPADYPNTNVINDNGNNITLILDSGLSRDLRAQAQEWGISLNTLIMAIYALLLSKYTHLDDICFGVPFFNRDDPNTQNLIGMFVNPLPFRVKLQGIITIRQLIDYIQAQVTALLRYQDTPLRYILDLLDPSQNQGVYYQLYSSVIQVDHLNKSLNEEYSLYQDYPLSRYPLEFSIDDIKDKNITIYVTYQTRLYQKNNVCNILNTFHLLLKWFSKNQDSANLKNATLISMEDYQDIIFKRNQTCRDYDCLATISALFEQQTQKTPDTIALFYADKQFSYAQLNQQANQLALYLKTHYTIQPNDLIALCLDRSEFIIIAILGVFKAGGAYVPIDPSYPPERIALILKDSKAKVVLTGRPYHEKLASYTETIVIDDPDFQILLKQLSSTNLPSVINSNSLAYVIYTSGTTGKPKGVMIRHQSVVNLCDEFLKTHQLNQNKRVGVYSNYVFDAFVNEVLPPLLNGNTLFLFTEKIRLSLESLIDFLADNDIQITFVPSILLPDFLNKIADRPKNKLSLNMIYTGGERLTLPDTHLFEQGLILLNEYGPTEVTVCATWHRYAVDDKTSNIGKPIQNTQCYILDTDLNPLPIGAIGELYIGGAGLASGYLNQPELTAEKFISNPFQTKATQNNIHDNLIYKTGDLVKYTSNGDIDYIGRNDSQIKKHGYRIELSEIEAVLNGYPGIQQSKVLMRIHNEHPYVIAYYLNKQISSNIETSQFIHNWQFLSNLNYRKLDPHNFRYNTQGWNSSYTEKPIPKTDMHEWIDMAVQGIRQLNPGVVLEVGCGNGLILFNLIEYCDYYYAIDFSDNAIDYIQQILAEQPYKRKVKTLRAPAHDIPYKSFIDKPYDTLILNSVVQYFPTLMYLEMVITQAIDHIQDNGSIFIGDIRDYRLLGCFHYSLLQSQNSPITLGLINDRMFKEEELLISPAYFVDLKIRNKKITSLEICPKMGVCQNEMNHYRYDVILHIKQSKSMKSYPSIQPCLVEDQESLIKLLDTSFDCFLRIQYPNKRIMADYLAYQRLVTGEQLTETDSETILGLDELSQLIQEHGLTAKFMLDITNPLFYELLIYHNNQEDWFDFFSNLPTQSTDFANNPLGTFRVLKDDKHTLLGKYLESQLPHYMVPDQLVCLDKFPLTTNGKLDLKKLPDIQVFSHRDAFVAPQNELEQKVCSIVAETLHIKNTEVGLDDDFFKLGGDSLLMIRLIIKLSCAFNIHHLNVALFLKHKTIRDMLEAIVDIDHQEPIVIPKLIMEDYPHGIPLSFSQERLWFIQQYQVKTSAYHIHVVKKLAQHIHISRFEQAIQSIILRHEILHTLHQINAEGQGCQTRIDTNKQAFIVKHITYLNLDSLSDLIDTEISRPFDLACQYPLRVTLASNPDKDEHYLILIVHHIVFDGWSLDVFFRDLTSFYFGLNNLPVLTIQYKDFSVWQKKYLSGPRLKVHLDYWTNALLGYESLYLPLDKPRPKQISYVGDEVYFKLDTNTSRYLRALAQKLELSLYTLLLSAFYLLLNSYSQQEDIIIGTAVAHRDHYQLEDMIGFFVNTLVLRSRIVPEQSIIEYVKETAKQVIAGQQHQDLPFEYLVSALRENNDLSRHPIFQVFFAVNRFGLPASEPNGKGVSNLFPPCKWADKLTRKHQTAQFDLSLWIEDGQGALSGQFNYARNLFNASSIEQMSHTYTYFLDQIAQLKYDDTKLIKALHYLRPTEFQRVIFDWNHSQFITGKDRTIVQCFEDQVKKTPQNIAIHYQDKSLSYSELNQRANQLAHHLIKSHQITVEEPIILYLGRSELIIIAILAVLKSGAAYVPIEPNAPEQRVLQILTDTQAKLVVTTLSFIQALLRQKTSFVLAIDAEDVLMDLHQRSNANPKVALSPQNLAYILYTSGTTGQPKGVMQTHHNIVRLFRATSTLFKFKPSDVWILFHTYVFDFSVWEIWGALLHGAKLVIPIDDERKDPELFYNLCKKQAISVLNQTPQAFYQLIDFVDTLPEKDKLPYLRYIVFGGDKLDLSRLKPWIQRYGDQNPELINMYGITETSVHLTYKKMTRQDSGKQSLIGHCIPDQKSYVLNRYLNPLPIGAIGELYVGGDGLARGYLNRADLSAEKFIPNPFQSTIEKQQSINSRLYKSGDLVRYVGAGELEYFGRNDTQVKIRGYRIELGEVERVLIKSHRSIKQAIVIVQTLQQTDQKQLLAYYVADKALSESLIRARIENYLPNYMLPGYLIWIKKIPLTINGKPDIPALPKPEWASKQNYTPPRDPLETKICALFTEVLGLETGSVGLNHDFFNLGGNSILSVKLVFLLKKIGIPLSLKAFYEHPTVAKIVQYQGASKHEQVPMKFKLSNKICDALREHYQLAAVIPCTHMQQLMLLSFQQGHPQIYCFQACYVLNQPMITEQKIADIETFINNTDIFKTFFIKTDKNEFYQGVRHHIDFKITCEHLENTSQRVDNELIQARFNQNEIQTFQAFDPKEILIKIKVLITKKQSYWCVCMHHAIIDGWSNIIFLDRIKAIFSGHNRVDSTGLSSQAFYTYCFLDQEISKNKRYQRFWLRHLGEYVFPKPFNKIVNPHHNITSKTLQMDADLYHQIKICITESRTNPKTFFMWHFMRLLKNLVGEDVCIGVVTNTRRPEIEGSLTSMGMYWNLAPIRLNITNTSENVSKSFHRLIGSIDAEYGQYPFACILKDNHTERLFNTTFKYLEFGNNFENDLMPIVVARDLYAYPINFSIIKESKNQPYLCRIDFIPEYFTQQQIEVLILDYFQQLSKLGSP